MKQVLSRHGWSFVEDVGEDGSPRRYSRVSKNGKTAILMDCSGPEIPGHRLSDYVHIAKWLSAAGVKAPEIYETDEKTFAIVEDFSDVTMKKAIAGGADAKKLYLQAADILERLRAAKAPDGLPDYYKSHVHEGRRRVIDWYAPVIHQQKNLDGWVEEYLKVWDEIEAKLPPCPQGFLHVDFHAENLMVLPSGGLGVLDFQGAMTGPAPYDFANLLEDPRADVPKGLKDQILKGHDEAFRAWYHVLGTQFHCRVIGQFIRLSIKNGKNGYLSFIPRTESCIREALNDPLLARLKTFFSDIKLDFHSPEALNTRLKEGLIRPDAF